MYKIAVVGCGAMSEAWIEIAMERDDCKIVALVDTDVSVARRKLEKYQLDSTVYKQIQLALDNEAIDIVFDITPPKFHFDTVTTALKAGCHVFGEKPMSDSLEDALKMVACADETNKEYFIMQNRRYLPSIYAMKDFLQNNVLGHVGQLSADFQLNPHFGGFREEMDSPLIADMAIHTFDAARFISGKNPVAVYCYEFNPSWSWYKGHANAVCIFEMEDGSVFDYRGSWCANGLNTSWESEWRVSCEKGSLYWNGAEKLYYELEETSALEEKVSSIKDIKPLSMEKVGHAACIDEMFQALKNGTRPQTDCRDNIESIKMMYKAIESAKTKKLVLL